MDIEIPLLPVQREFIQAKDDFVAIVSGRSCGKTWIGVLDAILEVLRGNNILYMCHHEGSMSSLILESSVLYFSSKDSKLKIE